MPPDASTTPQLAQLSMASASALGRVSRLTPTRITLTARHRCRPADGVRNPPGNCSSRRETDDVLKAVFGGGEEGARNWHPHFRTWRKRRLRQIEREYGDRLDEVAAFLKEFATKIETLGPRGYLESMAHRQGEELVPDDEPQPSDHELREYLDQARREGQA
jgi:hypothetical protein